MINWYRALLRHRMPAGAIPISVPTLILWGRQDKFLMPELAQRSLNVCREGKLIWLDRASHWVQHEEASAVSFHLLQWFVAEPARHVHPDSHLGNMVAGPRPIQVFSQAIDRGIGPAVAPS